MSKEHKVDLLKRSWTVVGALLILAALIGLGGRAFGVDQQRLFWPMFVIWPGVLLCGLALVTPGRTGVTLMVIGSALAMIGFILQYQAMIDRFESWAYAWALIPTAIGLGLVIFGRLRNRPDVIATSQSVLVIGLVLFGVGLLFFEGIVGLDALPDMHPMSGKRS